MFESCAHKEGNIPDTGRLGHNTGRLQLFLLVQGMGKDKLQQKTLYSGCCFLNGLYSLVLCLLTRAQPICVSVGYMHHRITEELNCKAGKLWLLVLSSLGGYV